MILKFEVNGDDLRLKSSVSQGHTGNVNTYICQFQFNEEWDGLTPFMVIKTGTRYLSPIAIVDSQGIIPAEVLENQGVIQIGIYGTSGADATYRRISSGWITLHITEGAYCSGTTPETPAPDIWEQYLAKVQETAKASAEDILADMDERVTALEKSSGNDTSITVDSELSAESENPVQNKAIFEALADKQDTDFIMTMQDGVFDKTYEQIKAALAEGRNICIRDSESLFHPITVLSNESDITIYVTIGYGYVIFTFYPDGRFDASYTELADKGAENVNIAAEQTATGVTITVTDREGTETSVHIDTLTAIKTWEDVKNAVRLGLGPTLFPVGYEFTTEDSITGAVITWVVRGHDHHTAANNKLTHSMTLETKYVYSLASGAYRSFVFDATEALYYAAKELPAGTYNFTLPAGYDEAFGGGKTLSFTLTQPVPAGGVIMFPWDNQKQSTDIEISTYASNAATAAIESVAVTESADGTSLGTADGTIENLNHAYRIRYGSNNYAQSAARQWLNSDAVAGAVWTPQHIFDRPPSWNTSYSGFLLGLPADFLAVVETAAIPCRTNSVFEVNSLDGTEFATNQVYTLKDKFFLLSRPEIYGNWDSATYKDGELLEFYDGLTDTERIKYDAAGSARSCWLRSPATGTMHFERLVHYTLGALTSSSTNNALGVAPACIIA